MLSVPVCSTYVTDVSTFVTDVTDLDNGGVRPGLSTYVTDVRPALSEATCVTKPGKLAEEELLFDVATIALIGAMVCHPLAPFLLVAPVARSACRQVSELCECCACVWLVMYALACS